MSKILNYIRDLPEVRTGIFILSVLLSGILCSGFITEITINGKLEWFTFYKTTTFWLLCAYAVLLYLYNRFIYLHEKNILRFLDDDYCKAYIINQCLPEITERYKKDIKEGKQLTELIDIRAELKKLKK
ncbi:hypothetical protein [Cyclobacterium xiamenense]|uniref:hypothetical protein n=1 Tax=Cyclobacterium xiamenense TaxID=1297121 RepID=UPI0035CF83B4